jgi:hypothetical protein
MFDNNNIHSNADLGTSMDLVPYIPRELSLSYDSKVKKFLDYINALYNYYSTLK